MTFNGLRPTGTSAGPIDRALTRVRLLWWAIVGVVFALVWVAVALVGELKWWVWRT